MTEESVSVPEPAAGNQQEEKRMETYLVAYLDFLGASEKMKKDNGELLNKISKLYNHIVSVFSNRLASKRDIKMKMFSDNIIIALKVEMSCDFHEYYSKYLALILHFSAVFQEKCLKSLDLLLRGGITQGDLYIDENLVWGPALVDAYQLENTVALYPRIVIDSSLMKFIQEKKEKNILTCEILKDSGSNDFAEKLKKHIDEYWDELLLLIKRDVDGVYYLRYLHYQQIMINRYMERIVLDGDKFRTTHPSIVSGIENIPKRVESARDALIKTIDTASNIRDFQKIIWNIHYHNSYCTEYGYPDFCIPEEAYSLSVVNKSRRT